MMDDKKTPTDVINDLYFRCLGRSPTPAESKELLAAVEAEKDKQDALEDVFWSLLNSKEFVFNH